MSRAVWAVTLMALMACGAQAGSLPPMGPWRGSAGDRSEALGLGVGDSPLVSRCEERWRDTRLDHFT